MTRRLALAAASLLLLCSARAFAFSEASAVSDVQFSQALSPAFAIAADGQYKLVERKAKQALELLKDLREFSHQVKDGSDKLRHEMLDRHYEDWVNTKLSPVLFEARAANETLDKTYDLEKGNVGAALKTAKAGDYGPIEAAIARIQAFEAEHETGVKAVDGRVTAVRRAYERHYGNAQAALAAFTKVPLIAELLAANPKLVKKIELVPASVRPLQWSVRLEKQAKDSNDPRLARIPRSISIQDGANEVTYPVVVR